jgi:hypothetical protein
MINRRNVLIEIGIALVILIIVFISLYFTNKSPSKLVVSINKDTGQTIIDAPNQQPEDGGGNDVVTILGDGKFITYGMTDAQFVLAKQLITNYVNGQLGRKYTQVSILNAGFLSTGTEDSAKMRLGTSSTLLDLNISYTDLVNVDVTIKDPNGNSTYYYTSGEQTVSQATTSPNPS